MLSELIARIAGDVHGHPINRPVTVDPAPCLFGPLMAGLRPCFCAPFWPKRHASPATRFQAARHGAIPPDRDRQRVAADGAQNASRRPRCWLRPGCMSRSAGPRRLDFHVPTAFRPVWQRVCSRRLDKSESQRSLAPSQRGERAVMSDIKLFRLSEGKVSELASQSIQVEKSLQDLFQNHLEELLGVRFLASEHSTGPVHRGRIDTLGLDEDGAPVIIEYKRAVNINVINQGLFYLDWLMDHQKDFEWLVLDKLGPESVPLLQRAYEGA